MELAHRVVNGLRGVTRQSLLVSLVLLPVVFLGCSAPVSEPVRQPFSPGRHRAVRIQSCVDQSAYKGNWNLGAEATRALTEKVMASGNFEIAREPSVVFSCDVDATVDRNAFQRGVLPNWSLTGVRVNVIAWEKPGDKLLASFRGFAASSPGATSGIGAERVLVRDAINDLAGQLEAWVKGSGTKE